MTEQIFSEGIEILLNAGMKYQTKPNKKMMMIWKGFLENIDDDNWMKIVQYWIENKSDFPTIAELKAVYSDMTTEKVNIRLAIERSQFGREYCDPLVKKAVMRCGGFYRIGQMNDRDYDFALRDIEKEYRYVLKEEKLRAKYANLPKPAKIGKLLYEPEL